MPTEHGQNWEKIERRSFDVIFQNAKYRVLGGVEMGLQKKARVSGLLHRACCFQWTESKVF